MTHSLLNRYESCVAHGEIERDLAQVKVLRALEDLLSAVRERRLSRKSHALGWLFGKGKSLEPVKGLYIWGDVGRGKTMLMDLFMLEAPAPARRVHFHAFMADVHERIFTFRQRVKQGLEKDTDPIPVVAAALADEATLLCFDEFMVRDIADAMIIGRLFTRLFTLGVVVVATSNIAPDKLYEGGLNRALFLPFLDLLSIHMTVMKLEARTDFRLEKLETEPVYHTPLDARTADALDSLFRHLTGDAPAHALVLDVKGHEVPILKASSGVAFVTFSDMCEQPLGARDYLMLAQTFHTVIIMGIKVMGEAQRNEAKRFMTLIDALYDVHVKVIISAEAEPDQLYTAQTGAEAFEFARTVSRLMEMRSRDYLALPHGRAQGHTSSTSMDTAGLVET